MVGSRFSSYWGCFLVCGLVLALGGMGNCISSSPRPEGFEGFTIHVDFGDRREDYYWESMESRADLAEILASMSLNQEPSMRFITTNQSWEVYDILGTRNRAGKAWVVFVDGEEIPPTRLARKTYVRPHQTIILRYQARVILPLVTTSESDPRKLP